MALVPPLNPVGGVSGANQRMDGASKMRVFGISQPLASLSAGNKKRSMHKTQSPISVLSFAAGRKFLARGMSRGRYEAAPYFLAKVTCLVWAVSPQQMDRR